MQMRFVVWTRSVVIIRRIGDKWLQVTRYCNMDDRIDHIPCQATEPFIGIMGMIVDNRPTIL